MLINPDIIYLHENLVKVKREKKRTFVSKVARLIFTSKKSSDGESQAGRANGSVSRFPPAKSRDRRRSREGGGRGAKTSGDESDDNGRARRARRREERMRAVMTDTEAVMKTKGSSHHR